MKSMKHTYAIVIAGVLTAAPAAQAQDKQTQQAAPRSAPAPAPPPARQAAPSSAPARAQAPPARAVDRSPGVERAVPRSAPPSRVDSAPARREPLRVPAPVSAAAAADDQGRPRTAHSGGTARGATPRTGGTTSRAVPRSQPPDGSRTAPDSGTVAASPRSRGDRQSYGVATARRYPPHPPHGGGYYPWSDPWWWNSYPYSFGFYAWDPFWYGASYPVYGGYGYGGGYGYDAGYGYGSSGYGLYGALKLKVKPRDAEVFVDGYFVGRVDDYDGVFQKLNLESGPHRIEIRAPGYVPLSFDVRIEFDETTTYRGELQPVQ
jgi:PEGA domain